MSRNIRHWATRGIGIGLLGVLVATPILAQQRERLPRECMREIRQLCGTDRSQIRSCLRERYAELSDNCAGELRERMEQRRGDVARSGRAVEASAAQYTRVSRTVIFGDDSRQQVDLYEPADAVEATPLILFVHGGGWSAGDRVRTVQAKPAWFNAQGYYFGSTGYRLVPNVTVEEQAADIGAAVQAMRAQASAIGFDGSKIVLMGHSAGAHLAALVASDPQYAGDAFGSIAGVILLDGAGYDIEANLAEAGPQTWQVYTRAFGEDTARHAALSPVTHVGGPDAPEWLALYVAERGRAKAQAELLTSALSQAGARAEALSIENTDHGRMNREIGLAAGSAQTDAIKAFLDRIFG